VQEDVSERDRGPGPGSTWAGRTARYQAGQVVQEIGYDDDCDEDLRDAIGDVEGVELVGEDYDDVVDVVLLWWRDETETSSTPWLTQSRRSRDGDMSGC